MKRKNYVILVVSVFVALIVSLVFYIKMKNVQPPKAEIETQSVVVASVNIPWGARITNEMVKTMTVPKGNMFSGCYSECEKIVGRVSLYPINANEPILESRLAPLPSPTAGVASLITMNKRAVAIKVDKNIGVSGFIHPANRVDVLVTLPELNITKTILENILVLAVGTEVTEKGKGEKPMITDVITLEMTPDEAERLALASSEGKLLLTLRNYGDSKNVLTKGIQIPNLLNAYSSAPVQLPGKASGPKTAVSKTETKATAKAETTVETKATADSKAPTEKKDESKAKKEEPAKKFFVVEILKGTKRSEAKLDVKE